MNDADEPGTPGEESTARRHASRALPSRRATAIAAVVFGALNALMFISSGSTGGQVVAAALFMTGFVYVGIRVITNVLQRHRPSPSTPGDRDPSAPPPPGGWANPTTSQRALTRLRRMTPPSRRSELLRRARGPRR